MDVGGFRLHISCSGEGAPTVVLDAGLASDNHDWEPVAKRVSKFTRVCSYDRAGLGASDDAPGIPTSRTASEDLHRLLSAAGVSGPFVMVGHSYGGLNVRLYAILHSDDVAGVILVDSLHSDNFERAGQILGEQAMAALMRGVESNPEGVDLTASMNQLKSVRNLGDLPLTVITAGQPGLPPFIDREIREQLAGSWLESQRELVRLSSAGVHVIAEESGHCVQCDQPSLVADAIREMVEATRK